MPKVILEHAASRAQQRLWFVEQLAPGEPLHNINVELRFGELDPAAFGAAVGDLVGRHEALRTALRSNGAELRQVVYAAPDESPLRVTDCSAEAEPEAVWQRIRAEEASRPFELDRCPLLRAHLVRLGAWDSRLALVVHHTVADAWSVGVIISDLCAAYLARRSGVEPDWAPLPVQYADFTAWQEQRLASAEATADLAYWRGQLADLPTLDLTRGRPRPAEPNHRGGRIDLHLPAADVQRLAAVAAAENASPFMAFTALWAEAVGRWFGSSDVPLGTPVAGRPLAEVAGVVGLFVDRLVLRVDTSGRPSTRELIRRVRDVVLDAHEHDSVTFEQVVDAVRPERRLGVTPLFQAAINLVPRPEQVSLGRGELSPIDGGQYANGTVRHDLNLELTDGPDGLTGAVEYRFGVLDEADAGGIAGLTERLLSQAAEAPDRPLHLVPTLAAADRAAALRDGGPAPEPTDRVDTLVAAAARRTPDATAVVAPGARLTYADLVAHANTLARTLAGLGVGPETTVLLAVPRRAELVVGLLGVLAAGAAYLPVDPDAPAAHLSAVAGDAGARIALVLPGSQPALPDDVRRVELRLGPTPADPGPPSHRAGPGNAAYLLFTSGSTGRPKGVVVEHRQLTGYLHACLRLLDPPEGASYLMVQPPTFDSCATSIYGALSTGGTLHLVDADTARDPDALGRYCAEHPIDYLKIAPSHLAALLAGGEQRLVPRRALVLGGEGCSRRFTRELTAAGWNIVVHYGPTETTVGVLGGPLTDRTGGDCPTTPLGGPFAGVRAYLLDERGDPVPAGCPGELYIGGDLVARGYAAGPARTAESFLPDPFAGTPGARMYRTGDLVRALPDGSYEFCGRLDRQVKIAGQRVELGAVEAVLERHPAVRSAVVVPRGAALVGYVVAADAGDPAGDPARDPAWDRADDSAGDSAGDSADDFADRLRDHVAAVLPGYCVPAAVVTLDELPRTANGKLDLRALPDPEPSGRPGRAVPPESPVEVALAAIWRRVLGRDEIGVTDRFFDSGGDSIRVIEVVAAARAAGVALAARDVFERQTIRELARVPVPTGVPVQASAGGLDGLGGAVTLPFLPFESDGPAGSAGSAGDGGGAAGVLAGRSAVLAPLVRPATGRPALAVTPAGDRTVLRADPVRVGDAALAEAAWLLADADRPAAGDLPPAAARSDLGAAEWRSALAAVQAADPPPAPAGTATARRPVPADTLSALAGPAHVAYGTVTGDLLVAAVAAALAAGAAAGAAAGPAPVGLLAADPAALAGSTAPTGRTPPCPMVVAPSADRDAAIRSAKAAVRRAVSGAGSWAALRAAHELDDVTVPGTVVRLLDLPPAARFEPDGHRLAITLAGTELVVHGPGPVAEVAELAESVVRELTALGEHCVGHREVYAVEDFPDSGLDAEQLDRLFANLGVDGAGR